MAEQKLLKLTISRVDGAVFSGDVVSVSVPGVLGDMQILAQHEALISPLKKGSVSYEQTDGSTRSITIDSGTIEISNTKKSVIYLLEGYPFFR